MTINIHVYLSFVNNHSIIIEKVLFIHIPWLIENNIKILIINSDELWSERQW